MSEPFLEDRQTRCICNKSGIEYTAEAGCALPDVGLWFRGKAHVLHSEVLRLNA